MGRVRKILTFRNRVLVLVLGTTFVVLSLFYTNSMANRLREKEQHDVELWARAMERVNRDSMDDYMGDPLIANIVNNRNNIPFLITDENLRVVSSHLIPERVIGNPDRLRRLIDSFSAENTPIIVRFWWTNDHYHIIFYGKSTLLKSLYYFPFIQIFVIIIFVVMLFIAFRSTKQDEQNRVWIGLAKETAHQLGTPTSSLLGWIEYLRSQNVDQSAVDEMSKDLAHLMKIVDRFSKIGSETTLAPANVNEVVGESVMYFRKRIPRNVTLDYNGLAIAPVQANLNTALFEWVVENMLKNSLDALQGHGSIDVHIDSDDKRVWIDVKDTGKGIPKANWKKIFEPGFTTKTRGWGLGLSLSRRIIEEYHGGKIAVVESEPGHGTTIRITLKRSYDTNAS
ncbi:MAG TPA: HAMP domain-containing histidine kinase [Candidatus Alistipes excrementipullorum]|mgnify:FL=1|nr:HAMP domain-containing histidine kinase [Candidatus Alistipes excrementipullorum]